MGSSELFAAPALYRRYRFTPSPMRLPTATCGAALWPNPSYIQSAPFSLTCLTRYLAIFLMSAFGRGLSYGN